MIVPAWGWVAFVAGLVAVVAAELVLGRRFGQGSAAVHREVTWVVVYVALAVTFGLGVGAAAGWGTAGQFFAGYLTEYSLSLDNLFIFYVIMSWFAVPAARQQRVLLAAIGLALVLQSALILAGAAALSRYGWLFYPLGAILIWTSIGLVTGQPGHKPEEVHSRLMSWLRRRVIEASGDSGSASGSGHAWWLAARPTLVLVLAIAVADVVFALDSIPAVFGITTSAYLIVACNALALMGLRQLYVLLTRVLDRLIFLNNGLAIVCAFIGVKLLLQALRGSGVAWVIQVPAWLSVTVVAAVLLITVIASTMKIGRTAGPTAANQSVTTVTGNDPVARDGLLIGGERALFEQRFAVMDINRNGVWDRGDYEQLTRQLCAAYGHATDSAAGRGVDSGHRALFDALARHMDANGDQQISPEEFAAAAGRPIKDQAAFDTAVQTTAHALIELADCDHNGQLDLSEYTQLTAVYGITARDAAQTFGQLDLDDNGFLDSADVARAIIQFFTSRKPDACGTAALS